MAHLRMPPALIAPSALPHNNRAPAETQAWRCPEKLHYGTYRSQDVDEHAQTISHWSQQYDQISQGRFQGTLRQLWMEAPRIQVFHEHTAQQTSQHCLPWRGSIWFGIPDGRSGISDLRFCGRPQPHAARPLLSARSGEQFSLRTPQEFGIYGVVLDEDWLRQRLAHPGACTAFDTPALRASLHATLLQPRTHSALCETIETLLRLAAAGDAAQPWSRTAMQVLVDDLLGLLCNTQQDASPLRAQTTQRRLRVVMEARAMVLQPGNRNLTVNELCSQLHVTRRTLQNHFQSAVGESPLDFLKAVRLNACRRTLRAASGRCTVQEAADEWGFSHMGHFSQDYKTMFGELPSQTLRQAQTRR